MLKKNSYLCEMAKYYMCFKIPLFTTQEGFCIRLLDLRFAYVDLHRDEEET
jgi:hypothetical protein